MTDDEVATALEKERFTIAELLERAGVAYGAAENLVVEALLEWDAAGRKPALIEIVDSRCREYAGQRNRSYLGLKETRAAIRRAQLFSPQGELVAGRAVGVGKDSDEGAGSSRPQ